MNNCAKLEKTYLFALGTLAAAFHLCAYADEPVLIEIKYSASTNEAEIGYGKISVYALDTKWSWKNSKKVRIVNAPFILGKRFLKKAKKGNDFRMKYSFNAEAGELTEYV